MRTRILRMLPAALLFLYLLQLLLMRLSAYPYLHGDEAWFGLRACEFMDRGLDTPHGMHAYVGSLFSWMLSGLFSWRGIGVFELRLPSALLNAAAALLVLVHLARRFGAWSATAWLYLLLSSPFFLLYSRLGWEVCALQNLMLAVILLSSRALLEGKGRGLWAASVFLAANYVGSFNHFIFLSVPLSLFVLAFSGICFQRDWERLGFFRLCCWNLLLAAALFLIKPAVSQEAWKAHRPLFAALFIALPLVFAAAHAGTSGLDRRIRALFESRWACAPRTRKVVLGVLIVGLLPFLSHHLPPMVEIESGVAVFKRVLSWSPPWVLSIPLHLWAAGLFLAYGFFAFRSLRAEDSRKLAPYERFLVFWPLAYAAVFFLFRQTSSVRYYLIPWFLFAAAAAFVLPRLPALRRWSVLVPLLCAGLLTNGLVLRELAHPRDRDPLGFKLGFYTERSRHFLPKRELFDLLAREKVCRFAHNNSFIDIPMMFLAREHPYDCDLSKAADTSYCPECTEPRHYRYEIIRE